MVVAVVMVVVVVAVAVLLLLSLKITIHVHLDPSDATCRAGPLMRAFCKHNGMLGGGREG